MPLKVGKLVREIDFSGRTSFLDMRYERVVNTYFKRLGDVTQEVFPKDSEVKVLVEHNVLRAD